MVVRDPIFLQTREDDHDDALWEGTELDRLTHRRQASNEDSEAAEAVSEKLKQLDEHTKIQACELACLRRFAVSTPLKAVADPDCTFQPKSARWQECLKPLSRSEDRTLERASNDLIESAEKEVMDLLEEKAKIGFNSSIFKSLGPSLAMSDKSPSYLFLDALDDYKLAKTELEERGGNSWFTDLTSVCGDC